MACYLEMHDRSEIHTLGPSSGLHIVDVAGVVRAENALHEPVDAGLVALVVQRRDDA